MAAAGWEEGLRADRAAVRGGERIESIGVVKTVALHNVSQKIGKRACLFWGGGAMLDWVGLFIVFYVSYLVCGRVLEGKVSV